MTAPPTLPAIAQLLPHRPPMVLLVELVSFAAEGSTCSALGRAACVSEAELSVASPELVREWQS